jgi:rRNA-processing protein FCF1/predicted membrane protein
MKILLDTNIILIAPTILSNKKSGVSLIVPFPVRLELATVSLIREGVSSISKILDAALRENIIQIYKLSSIPSIEPPENLSKTDIELITAAQELQETDDDVQIATEDKTLSNFAATIGIKCINLNQLKKIFLEDTDHDSNIQKKAKSILNAQSRSLIIGIIVGFLINLLVFWIWSNFEKIINTAAIWGTIILIIAVGILLYSLRGRFRLQYGIFEFFFGIVIALKVLWPDFDYSKFRPFGVLQIMAGIYVMVRGLDNIGKVLKGTRFGPFWNKISGER